MRKDIFGFHPNTFQGADHLAQKCGCTIAMPDFFRGKAWKTDNIPPKEGRPAMQAYIQSIGSWEIVKPDLVATIEFLRGEGMVDIGVSCCSFLARVVFRSS
jgi:dienelactone hydrolase